MSERSTNAGERTKRSTRRDVQAENRRNQLLAVALSLFADRGVENVSIKQLAAETGVAQGLIYHYFRSKDELLTAVIQRYNPLSDFQSIAKQLADLPAREGLLLLAQRLSKLMPEKRLVLRLLVRELLSSQSAVRTRVISFRKEALGPLVEYFQRRIDAGELRTHQPILLIHMLISSLLALLLLEQPLDRNVPEIVDIILYGVTMR